MADINLQDVRAKFPQYKDMSDDQLAQGLHQKYYADMPFDQFSQKIGYAPQTNLVEDAGKNLEAGVKGSALYGAADIAASGASKLGGKIAGGIAGLAQGAGNALGVTDGSTSAADRVAAVKGAPMFNYEADSPGAQKLQSGMSAIAKPFQAVAAPIDKAVDKLPNGPQTVIHGAEEAIPDVASVLPLGQIGRIAKTADAAAVVDGAATPHVAPGANAITTGRAAGFKFTPGGAESRMPSAAANGEIPQSFAVTPNDRRAINLHNQAKVTELSGQQIGKEGATELAQKDFEDAKVPHLKTYNDTGAVLGSGLKGSDDLVSTLQSRLADNTQTALKGPVASQTQRILNAASSGNLSGPQLVKDISWMRANGGRSIASALESEMDSQLATANAGPQLDKFRQARTGLAQIYNLQDATKGGQIDASKLAALDQKNPNLLTGNLKLIAQTAAASPQDFRLPSGVQPGSSPISKPTWAGAAKVVAGKAAKVLAPARFDATSDAFQNRFGRAATPAEASYFPDLGKRPAAPSKPFELQQPPGSAAVPPRQGAIDLPPGREPAPKLDLAPPEGEVGVNPQQLGMQIAQGRPAAPSLDLAHPEGNVGVNPTQLGMAIAQGRPMGEQQLGLKPTEGSLEPHQPSLLGHPGTPEGGGPSKKKPKPKAKDDGKE